MSEYQYYEFQAVDAGLSAKEMAELRSISTRATITPTSFVNEYHWGDLRADPDRLLQRYFDAFLYTANWGTRRLSFRLPLQLLSAKTAEMYCYTEAARVRTYRGYLFLEVCCSREYGDERFEEDKSWWEEVETGQGRLASMISARADLVDGDLRLLYLSWLLSADLGLLEDEELEPPVPANLRYLPAALAAMVDFFGLDPCLVSAAAETSQTAATSPSQEELQEWIAGLSERAKNAFLLKIVRDQDPHLGAQMRRQARAALSTAGPGPQKPTDVGSNGDNGQARTAGDLLLRAAQLRRERQAKTAEARERENERLQREAAAQREKRLDTLEEVGDHAWDRLDPLMLNARAKEYDQAVRLLLDLRDLGQLNEMNDQFSQRLSDLRTRHSRRTAFIRRLDEAGL